MTNQKVKEIFWDCYNVFWNRWKDIPLPKDSRNWDTVMEEFNELARKHDCELCRRILIGLLEELERRGKVYGKELQCDRCPDRGSGIFRA